MGISVQVLRIGDANFFQCLSTLKDLLVETPPLRGAESEITGGEVCRRGSLSVGSEITGGE